MSKEYPSKLYYSISEVASLTEVKAHVLRYWETEFPTLRPKKTRTGSRRYRQTDIDEILAIKELLYVEGFKIAGARKMRRQARSRTVEATPAAPTQMALGFDSLDDKAKLGYIRDELQSLLSMVKEMAEPTAYHADTPDLKEMKGEG
jgi:DNA-binding transcriptional MerR regulator